VYSGVQHSRSCARDREAKTPANATEHGALDEQLSNDPAPRRPDSHASRDLART
jgi:hypothetical protein